VAENLCTGAMGTLQATGARREKEQAKQEEMGNVGYRPSSFIAQGRPTVDLHDRR